MSPFGERETSALRRFAQQSLFTLSPAPARVSDGVVRDV